MEIHQEHDIITLTCHDEEFPISFIKIGSDCPAMIHCKGNLSLLTPQREPHRHYRCKGGFFNSYKKTYALGNKLAKDGSIIVSGLALGCDKAAHEGCLDAGGKTIAIVASGLNIIHPKENTTLPQRIMDNNSLVLSEYPLGVKVNSSRLIARNRLQAALSESVILVECPEHSGSMHIQCALLVNIKNNVLHCYWRQFSERDTDFNR